MKARTTEEILDAIFGRRPRSIYMAVRLGLVPDAYMPEAMAILGQLSDKPKFGRRPRSIYMAVRLGLVPDAYMPEAMAILGQLSDKPKVAKWAIPARSLYNDPGWDNVIRAYEEDR